MTANEYQKEAISVYRLYAEYELSILTQIAKDSLKTPLKQNTNIKGLSGESKELMHHGTKSAYEYGISEYKTDRKDTVLKPLPKIDILTKELKINNVLDDNVDIMNGVISRDITKIYTDIGYTTSKLLKAKDTKDTISTVVQKTLNSYANSGITSFVDTKGRRWGMQEYAYMVARTSNMQTTISGYTDYMLENNDTLVVISDHADECALCAPWEGKVLTISDDKGYNTLDNARNSGLFHPNCMHTVNTYYKGVEYRKPKTVKEKQEDSKNYTLRQRQRQMERTSRLWSRRQAVAITPEAIKYTNDKRKEWTREITTFTKKYDLPRERWRENIL